MNGRRLLAVDWGTSSLRGALVGPDGQVLAERALARGILSVAAGDFPAVFEAAFGDWMTAGTLPPEDGTPTPPVPCAKLT